MDHVRVKTEPNRSAFQLFLHPLTVPDTVGLCGPERGPEFFGSGCVAICPCGSAPAGLAPQR